MIISPLKMWVQNVLPVVYDDSLSYMEMIAKINAKTNEIITQTNENTQSIETLANVISQLGDIDELIELLEEVRSVVDDVETLKTEVDLLNKNRNSWDVNVNGKIVFMGNSYGVNLYGYDPWPKIVANFLNAGTENTDWFNICGSGHSLSNADDTMTFINDITNFYNNHTDIADEIGGVVLVAGVNDSRPARSPLALQKLGELASYIKTHFPNAKLYNGFCGWWRGTSANIGGRTLAAYGQVCEAYKQAKKFGWNYLTGIENVYHYKELIVDINPSGNDDGVHPTEQGQIEIANAVANAICVGSCGVTRHVTTSFSPVQTGDSLSGSLDEWTNDSSTYAKLTFACQYATPINLQVNSLTDLALVDSAFSNLLDFAPIMVLCLDSTDGTTRVPVMCRMFVQGGKLTAQVKAILNGENTLSVSRIYSAITIDSHPTIGA